MSGELLPETDALARILAQVEPLPAERTPLLAALGRYAAKMIWAGVPMPGFDNSSMDGYAISWDEPAGDLPAGTRLEVCGEQPAGPDLGLRLEAGQAARVFTGAPIPVGTRAVVMQEDVERADDGVTLRGPLEPGENIRRAGAEVARGQKLLDAGERLTAPCLGLLAAQGLAEVEVGRAPRVAVLATGDELRAPGEPLRPGEIYESNGVMLAALAAALGAQVTRLEPARDDRAALDARVAEGLAGHDVLIVAGGVSVGERDFVKASLAAVGVRQELWRVRVRPGKPFLYGRAPAEAGGAHVFGLPGNPVSAFVTFLLFARPALLRLMGAGADALTLPGQPATAAVELANRGDRPHYQHGTLDEAGRFTPAGRQESHALFSLSRGQALVRVEVGAVCPAGGPVRALSWD